jgi:predicted DsbA family dithiol-disulfide isomerase
MSEDRVQIEYFSDLLCIWAYVAEVRVDELRHNFGQQVELDYRFVPIFGSVRSKLERQWSQKGGMEWYASHVAEIAAQFDHIALGPDAWKRTVPAGSTSAHLFARAVGMAVERGEIDNAPHDEYGGRSAFEELVWRLRLAFFRDAQDIARLDVQLQVAEELELPTAPIRRSLQDGTASAALAEDQELATRHQVTGSPTFLFNEGRQKLYGNVGYRIVEANLQELLRDRTDRASWC